MVWKDFTECPLKRGEDVILAIGGELHSGVVVSENASLFGKELEVSYNEWEGENEYVKTAIFMEETHPDGILKNIFKIRRQ